ncbi:GNAT family N-acetyltransferase [Salinispira pacifica]
MQRDGIFLRFLSLDDAEALFSLHVRNRDFFRPFITTRPPDFYTIEGQRRVIKRDATGREEGTWFSFGIFLEETGELIGNVSLTEVMHGPLQSCYIGYYLDAEQNGRGYATAAVKLALDFAFDELKLHRVEAGVMPHNSASMRVLEKCGFQKEGIARRCVEIDGQFRDHQILAVLADDPRPA